jgi:fumarylacetoacetate (FAA) hydrolase
VKLATLKDESRDGVLVVVDRLLKRAVAVPQIAGTLQKALDHWEQAAPELEKVYAELNRAGAAGGDLPGAFALDPAMLAAPLPRAYQWADGSAYVNHVELVRKARGARMPENFWTDPLMYQGGSDAFLGPTDPIRLENQDWGCDFEAEIAVITDDVPMASPPEKAGAHIHLLMLVNDVSLRNLIPNELAKGFGFFQSKPASAFSPVAVTPGELGDAWRDCKVCLPLETRLNGRMFGHPDAGVDMTFNFAQLISHAARTRSLCAGTIIGSGTVSNSDRSRGASCIAERRMLELLDKGVAETPFLTYGDRVTIQMLDPARQSIFGAINQVVQPYPAGASTGPSARNETR